MHGINNEFMKPAATIDQQVSLLLIRGVGLVNIVHYCPQESMVGSMSAAMVRREEAIFLLDNTTYDGKRRKEDCWRQKNLPGKPLGRGLLIFVTKFLWA